MKKFLSIAALSILSLVCMGVPISYAMDGAFKGSGGFTFDQLTALFLPLTGGTMAGNILASSGNDLGGSSNTWDNLWIDEIIGSGNQVDFTDTSLNSDARILTAEAAIAGAISLANGVGICNGVGNGHIMCGSNSNSAATVSIFGVGDTITSVSATPVNMQLWYGEGLTSAERVQTCDCGTTGTPNTVTCDIQSRLVKLIDGDADNCTVTIAETTAATINKDLPEIKIIVTNDGGGGTFNVADQAGVALFSASHTLSANDNISLMYDSTGDLFVETGAVTGH